MSPQDGPILLVDDDQSLLFVLARWLERDGFQVLTAPSVDAAARVVSPLPPAVIISDHLLPDDKTEADVAAAFPGIPLITISGYPRPAQHEGPWLMKPFTPATLVSALREL